ncbi:hypothetical protein Tco_0070889 [Tanacetum coccineum]
MSGGSGQLGVFLDAPFQPSTVGAGYSAYHRTHGVFHPAWGHQLFAYFLSPLCFARRNQLADVAVECMGHEVTGVHLSGSGVRPRMGRDPCGCDPSLVAGRGQHVVYADIGWDRPWAVPSHCGLLGLSPLLAV